MNLKRRVQVYLWKETQRTQTRQVRGAYGQLVDEKTTTYKYDAEWAGAAIDSRSFHDGSFSNPSWGEAVEVATSRAGLPFAAASWVQHRVELHGLELAQPLRAQAETDVELSPTRLALPDGSQAFLLHGR